MALTAPAPAAPTGDRLSLHHLTAMDVDAARLVALAAQTGCALISIFAHMPAPFDARYPMVREADVADLRRAMTDRDVGCWSLEVFPIGAASDWDAFARALDIGASLGAAQAVVHVQTDDAALAHDALGRLARLCASRGIAPAIEANPFSSIPGIAEAAALARRIGGTGVILDTLHFARGGEATDAIAAAADLIDHVQLSDGPAQIADEARWREAISARLPPGEGALPLHGMIAPLRPNLVFDVEVPSSGKQDTHDDAVRRVTRAVSGARTVLRQSRRGA